MYFSTSTPGVRLGSTAVLCSLALTCASLVTPGTVFAASPNASSAESTQPAANLNLSQALAKTLEFNPELAAFPLYLRQWQGRRQQAELKPGLRLSGGVENVLGQGSYSEVDRAEASLLLSQVFERGNKSAKRVALVDAKQEQQRREFELIKLDKLAQTSRRYYRVLRAQALDRWMQESIAQQRQALATITRLARAGVVTAADGAKIKLQLQSSQAQQAQLQGEQRLLEQSLANMWASELAQVSNNPPLRVQGELSVLAPAPSLAYLNTALDAAPAYLLAQSQSRVAQAAWYLAQSQAQADVDLGLGVKRFQASREQALMLEFSMPLFQGRRAQAGVEVAENSWQQRQQAESVQRIQLGQRLSLLRQSLLNISKQSTHLQEQLIPAAQAFQKESQKAYSNGQYSVLQWLDAQQQLRNLRRQLIELHSDYFMKFLELERLSGQSMNQVKS